MAVSVAHTVRLEDDEAFIRIISARKVVPSAAIMKNGSNAPVPSALRLQSRRFLWRFSGLAILLGLLSFQAGEPLGRALLPLLRAELGAVQDTFRIDRLYLDRDGTERVFRVDVGLAHDIMINGRWFKPDPRGRATASTLLDNVTLPAVLVIALAMAFPASRSAAYLWRAASLIPALLLLWSVDVPLALWSALWGILVDALEPDRFSPLLLWEHFLHSAGRLALAIALGALVGSIGLPRSAYRNSYPSPS